MKTALNSLYIVQLSVSVDSSEGDTSVSPGRPPDQAVGAVVPAGTRGDVTLCVALTSRKAVQGDVFS